MESKHSHDAVEEQFIQVERCIVELQRGRTIAIAEGNEQGSSRTVNVVETLNQRKLDAATDSGRATLVLTRTRARILGVIADSDSVCIELRAGISLEQVRQWAGLEDIAGHNDRVHSNADAETSLASSFDNRAIRASQHATQIQATRSDGAFAKAALQLTRKAKLLPAVVISHPQCIPDTVLTAKIDDVMNFPDLDGELYYMGSARVPLATASTTKLAVFREKHGSMEHVAVTVGNPDLDKGATVRIHSSCFTGDILSSMRCDCGEQLEGAIKEMAANGGGVVLYVSQEGRGIGLASKLRAYQLQDAGLDTIEANQHLGYGADERSYAAAASMLRTLGISRLKLMTNNPEKINALREAGFDVLERVPSRATVNCHNARYLETKQKKAGHLSVVG